MIGLPRKIKKMFSPRRDSADGVYLVETVGLDLRRLQAEGSDNDQEKERSASAINIGLVR